jgi:hypothetical protein
MQIWLKHKTGTAEVVEQHRALRETLQQETRSAEQNALTHLCFQKAPESR